MVVLILEVNCSPKEWIFDGEKILVERGQLITSLDILKSKISKGVKVGQIRTALNNLEKYGFIANQSTKTGRLITVLNYDKYQKNNSANNKADSKDTTKDKQISNKEPAPNNNENKENNVINKGQVGVRKSKREEVSSNNAKTKNYAERDYSKEGVQKQINAFFGE